MPLLTNNGRVLKNDRRILQSIASLSYITDKPRFLNSNSIISPASITLQFTIETTVYVEWGDGSPLEAFKTLQVSGPDSLWAVRFYDRLPGDNHPAFPFEIPAHVFTDSQPLHTVRVYYPTRQLYSYTSDNQTRPKQDFAFGFAQHTNLVKFTISDHRASVGGGGMLINLDVHNTFLLEQFTELGMSNSFDVNSPFYKSIPADLIRPTLNRLNCGEPGFFQGQSFDDNNLNKIVQAKGALTYLSIYCGGLLADTNPPNLNPAYPQPDSGPLPVSFTQLTLLTFLQVHHTKYTVIPDIFNQMPWLKTISFTSSYDLVGWGNLSAMVNLENISIPDCYSISTTVPAYFANLTALKTLAMDSCFPDSGDTHYRGAGVIDTWVSNLYDFVTAPGRVGWRDIIFRIGIYPGQTADTVSPDSDTKLKDLETNYGWNCTYIA